MIKTVIVAKMNNNYKKIVSNRKSYNKGQLRTKMLKRLKKNLIKTTQLNRKRKFTHNYFVVQMKKM